MVSGDADEQHERQLQAGCHCQYQSISAGGSQAAVQVLVN